MPEWLEQACTNDLMELGVIIKVYASNNCVEPRLSKFGREVLRRSLDVQIGMFECVCARFDFRWHGRIAAAYVQTARDMFPKIKLLNTCGFLPGLSPDQVDCGRCTGFRTEWNFHGEMSTPISTLVTGVSRYSRKVFVHSCVDAELIEFESEWFRLMHQYVSRDYSGQPHLLMTTSRAEDRLLTPHREEGVMLACAWAYRDHIAYRVCRDEYRTVLTGISPFKREYPLDVPGNEIVRVSEMDLCHSINSDASTHTEAPAWIVFTKTHRLPIVSGVVPLPNTIGVLFTRHDVDWSSCENKEIMLRGFRNCLLDCSARRLSDRFFDIVRHG